MTFKLFNKIIVILASCFCILCSPNAVTDSKMQEKPTKQSVCYIIYGNFSNQELNSFQKNTSEDILPKWVSFKIYRTSQEVAKLNKDIFENQDLVSMLDVKTPATLNKTKEVKHAIAIAGEQKTLKNAFDDYITINAYIDTILCSENAVSLLDYRIVKLYSAKERTKQFSVMEFDIQKHIFVSLIKQNDGLFWLHTKGLIKFGKPELAMHNVSEKEINTVLALLNDMANYMVLKDKIFAHEKEINEKSLSEGFLAFHKGNYNDDDYWGNIHIELIHKSKIHAIK